MKLILQIALILFPFIGLSQTEGASFDNDEFDASQFSTGVVYAEMYVTEKGDKAKVSFDFGNSEKSVELRKEALWDEEANHELVFDNTIDALNHLEKVQWLSRNVVIDKDGDELFKYFLLEKIAGY